MLRNCFPFLVFFFNLGFILIDLSVYFSFITFLPIVLLNIILGIDFIIRPVSSERDRYNRGVVAAAFVLMPVMLVLPYVESRFLMPDFFGFDSFLMVTLLGLGLMMVGGEITIMARFQLGALGGPKIVLEKEHILITTGLYHYIRHPMYLGFLMVFIGYALSFRGFIMTLVLFIGLFLIFRDRMELEEKLMFERFGEEYLEYSERTHRLLPFVY